MELAVIGKEDFCLGFSLAGIRNMFEIEDPSDSIDKVYENEDIGVVVFDESLSNKLGEFDKSRIENSVRPVFVMLSLNEESEELRKMIKKSIGVEL
jgi:V/A-type H+/Na+-transporting ATPase subunit F